MECKYFITSRKDSLTHYGVKGMKWGVRRYQNADGTLTAKGRERYRNTESGMSKYAGMLPKRRGIPSEYKEDSLKEVLAFDDGHGVIGYKSALDPDIRAERWSAEYTVDPDSAFEKHAAKVNRNHELESGTDSNCTKVAATMCLAKMGYDYDAGRCMGGLGRAFEYWFDGEEHTICDSIDSAIDEKFSKTPNGSFGTVDLRNRNGGGHVFNWERNSKGEFNLYEGQVAGGEKFSGSSPKECFDKYLIRAPWFMSDSVVRVYDMTDAVPNFDHMDEDSVVRIIDDNKYKSKILDTLTNKLYSSI